MLNLNPSFRKIIYHDVQEYYKCMQITNVELSSNSTLIDKLLQLSTVREKTLKCGKKDFIQTLAIELNPESQVEFGHIKYWCRHSNRGNDMDKAKREIWKV